MEQYPLPKEVPNVTRSDARRAALILHKGGFHGISIVEEYPEATCYVVVFNRCNMRREVRSLDEMRSLIVDEAPVR